MFATISSVLSSCGKIFFSGTETGCKNRACFGFLCLLLGLTISGGLILTLFLSKVGVGQVTLILSFSVGILISVLAYFFRSARCMSVLFLLACAMKEGRNVLIATGTSIVVFNNVRNILENLTVVASSLICNMEAKRDFLKGLTQFYTDLIKSVYLFAKVHFYNPFKDVVTVSDDFQFQNTIDDDKMKTFLNETQLQIQTVSTNLSSLFKFGTSVGHIAFLVLGISIISVGSGFFLRKFLKKIKANNLYITKAFLEYDEGQRKRHLRCVLPLSKKEKSQYIQIPSLKTSREQGMKMALFFLPILTNILIWGVILFLDFMLYWLILVIGKNLQSLDPVEVPITMSFSRSNLDLNDLFNLHWSNEGKTTSLRINLFEPQCIPKPEISLSASWIPLVIIISALLIFGGVSAFLIQIKLVVMASFYPDIQLERVRYLHQKILKERLQVTMTKQNQTIKHLFFQVNFWFPILTRKHCEGPGLGLSLG